MSLNGTSTEKSAAEGLAEAAPERYRGTAAPARRKVKSLLGWRLKHRLHQRDAARVLSVSQSTYARFEAKKRFPRPTVAKRIQIITGLSLEIILGLE